MKATKVTHEKGFYIFFNVFVIWNQRKDCLNWFYEKLTHINNIAFLVINRINFKIKANRVRPIKKRVNFVTHYKISY